VVITDTVGFIRDLPKDLFAAFRATFEEAADADLLLCVVDAGDDARDDHLRTVEHLVEDLALTEIPRVLVYNKVDLLDVAERRALEREHPEAAFVSARRRESTRPLIERIARELAGRWGASARGPDVEPPASEGAVEEAVERGTPAEMTTVEDMLRAAGKRVRARTVA
jgi:GTP-binding protein HflX